MLYTVHVTVMPLKELLDPQGKAVMGSLDHLGLGAIRDVRIGKHISLQIEAPNQETAQQIAESAATKLLANPVMEQFQIQVSES